MVKRLLFLLSVLGTFLTAVPVQADSSLPPAQRLGTGIPTSIAISPDGKTLAVGSSIGIWLLDSTTLNPTSFIPTSAWVDKVTYSADGRYLKLTIRPYNASSGVIDVFNVAPMWFFDQDKFFDWNNLPYAERHVHRKEVLIKLDTKVLFEGSQAQALGLTWKDPACDARRALCAETQVDNYIVIDQNTQIATYFFPDLTARDATLSADGTMLFGVSLGALKVWQLSSLAIVNERDDLFTGTLLQVRWSPDGGHITSGAVTWADTGGQSGPTQAVWGCAWEMADHCNVAPMAAFNAVYHYDPVTGQQTQRFVPHRVYLATAKLNADQTLLVTSGYGGYCPNRITLECAGDAATTRIWRFQPATQLAQLPTLLTDAAFSTDSRLVIGKTGSGVEVWDWQAGQRLWSVKMDSDCQYWSTLRYWNFQPYQRDRAEANCLAVDPLGRYVATYPNFSDSAVVHLWNLATGDLVATFTGHTSEITGVTFSPDGHQIAASSLDGTILIWNVP